MSARDTTRDELMIRNLLARIALEADIGESLDDYLDCFSEDAVWQMAGAPEVRGRDALRAGAERRRATGETGPGANTRHLITTMAVEIDGDRATSDAYWMFLGNTHATPSLRLAGHYRDQFVRSGSGWKLARRKITVG